MIEAIALLLIASVHPVEQPDDPPEETIDFFGRRRLCAQLAPVAERTEGERREAGRLACARLPDEERDIRARYPDHPGIVGWLARDALDFRLGRIEISSWDGPPPARLRHVVHTGTAWEGGEPYRLVVDSEADQGRSTRITASFAGLPERSFVIDNARFPGIDLQSARVWFGRRPPNDRLTLHLRYGYARGYCEVVGEDDRPKISLTFGRNAIEAAYQDRTNCGGSFRPLTAR